MWLLVKMVVCGFVGLVECSVDVVVVVILIVGERFCCVLVMVV